MRCARTTVGPPEFVFVSSDREQLAVAYSDAMNILDPEEDNAMAQLKRYREK